MSSRPLVIKVCGLKTVQDLEAAEGADLVGFVLDVPGSPRTCPPDVARDLVHRAQGDFRTVAVLVHPTAEKIRSAWDEVGADLVQIHGSPPQGLSRDELRRVLPSIPIPPPGKGGMDRISLARIRGPQFPYVHLDTAGGRLPGGTGRVLDWDRARALVRSAPRRPFLLAGGLTPENVGEAIARVRPAGVDVASGVESAPGMKDRRKVQRFIRAVRRWEEEQDA